MECGRSWCGRTWRRRSLEGAILVRANLEKALLSGANLEKANLEGANLKGAKNLTVGRLATVSTLYNAGINPPLLEHIRQQYPQLLKDRTRMSGNV